MPRRRAFVVVALALALMAAGCGDAGDGPDQVALDQILTAPPQLPLPTTPATTTTTIVELPIPIGIPADSYASEPVVALGSMEIPRIGLVHDVFQGVTLNNIDQGPSHWPGTALPGQRGNAVFAGHRVTRTRPFRSIDQLVPGDQVIFRINGVTSSYRVTGSQVVDPSATWIADQSQAATATLYACHPPGSAAERYVVHMALESTNAA